MDVLQSSASRRVFGPAEDVQRRRRERQKQAAELAAAAAEAAARGLASKGEASFFRESEETRHQLLMLGFLTDQAAAEAAGEESAARQAALNALFAARAAVNAGALTPSVEDIAEGEGGELEEQQRRDEGKVGSLLSQRGVGSWLRRFCICASGVARALEAYLEQPALLDAHLRGLVDILSRPLKAHLDFLKSDSVAQKEIPDFCSWRRSCACCCVRTLLHLIYILCKVMGGVSVRSLLPQEPLLLHTLLECVESQVLREADALRETTHAEFLPSPSEEKESANGKEETLSSKKIDEDQAANVAVAAVAAEVPQWSVSFSLFVWLSLLARTPFPLETLEPQTEDLCDLSARVSDVGLAEKGSIEENAFEVQRARLHCMLVKEGQTEEEAAKTSTSLGGRFLTVSFVAMRRCSKAAEGAALLLQAFFSRADLKDSTCVRLLLKAFVRNCEELLLLPFSEEESSLKRGGETQGPSNLFGGEQSNALGALCKVLKAVKAKDVGFVLSRIQDLLMPQKERPTHFGNSALFRKLQLSCCQRLLLLSLPVRAPKLRCCIHARSIEKLLEAKKEAKRRQQQKLTSEEETSGFAEADFSSLDDPQISTLTKHQTMEEAPLSADLLHSVETLLRLAFQLLGDSDARVRWVSAKTVGRLASRLPADLAKQVTSAVLAPFQDETKALPEYAANAEADKNAFFTAPGFSCLRSTALAVQTAGDDSAASAVATAAIAKLEQAYKENESEFFSASRGRLWEGTVLAVAELLRQGLIEKGDLSSALRFVCRSLLLSEASRFSSGGAGGSLSCRGNSGVCDAACYAAWAFARSYGRDALEDPALQLSLGRHLLLVLLFASDVSERKAAAAAYQEIEGRQGSLEKGLDVITAADFFLLSTRRASCLRAAPAVAALSQEIPLQMNSCFHALLASASNAACSTPEEQTSSQNSLPLAVILLEFLCCRVYRHPDTMHRQLAAVSAAKLCEFARPYASNVLLPFLLSKLLAADSSLPERHGALLFVGALVGSLEASPQTPGNSRAAEMSLAAKGIVPSWLQAKVRAAIVQFEKLRPYSSRGGDVLREAACGFISSLSRASSWSFRSATAPRYLETLLQSLRSLAETVQAAAVSALRHLFLFRFDPGSVSEVLTNKLLKALQDPTQLLVTARRGFVLALSALPPEVYIQSALEEPESSQSRLSLLDFLLSEATATAPLGVASLEDAETRRNALIALAFFFHAISPRCKGQEKGSEEDRAKAAASVNWRAVTECLYTAASDFSADSRGDVGSWIRETSAEVAALILEGFPVCCLKEKSCAGPSAEERRRLLLLLICMSFESLTRTRSRAVFLLHRLLAPISRLSEQEAKDEECASTEFQASWIFDRVFREFAYELSSIQPPLDSYGKHASPPFLPKVGVCVCVKCASQNNTSRESQHPRNRLFPFNPPELPLLQEAVGSLATLQWKQLRQMQPLEPFANQHLSDITSAVGAEAGAPSAEKQDEQIYEKNVFEGGFAELHRTRKTAVAVRLPIFCCPYELYRHFTPLLLVEDIAKAAADFAILGIGGPSGSVTSLAQEAFVDALNEIIPSNQGSAEDSIAAKPLLTRFVREEFGVRAEEAAAPAVAACLVGPLEAAAQFSSSGTFVETGKPSGTPGSSEFRRKKRDASLVASSLTLQYNFLSAADFPRVEKALLVLEENLAKRTKGGRGKSDAEFETLRRLCELAVSLAGTAPPLLNTEVELDPFITEAAVKAKRTAACVAIRFLRHPYPRIRAFAAERLYTLFLIVMPPTDSSSNCAFRVSHQNIEAAAALVAETTWTELSDEKSQGQETLRGKCEELASLLGLEREWHETSQ